MERHPWPLKHILLLVSPVLQFNTTLSLQAELQILENGRHFPGFPVV